MNLEAGILIARPHCDLEQIIKKTKVPFLPVYGAMSHLCSFTEGNSSNSNNTLNERRSGQHKVLTFAYLLLWEISSPCDWILLLIRKPQSFPVCLCHRFSLPS